MKPRIVAVHHWCKNGIPLTTVWTRRRGRRGLCATTTWHKVAEGVYAGHSTLDVPVPALGWWSTEHQIPGWKP